MIIDFYNYVEKLNNRNFKQLAQSVKLVKLVIDKKRKMGYLIGEMKRPTITNSSAF